MATIGQPLTTPEIGWTRYDNEDTNITYVGTWVTNPTSPSFWNSTLKYTSIGGDKCQFNFTGTKLRLIGMPYTNRSTSVDVFIDGLKVTTFSQSTGNAIYCALDADIQNLANGEHSVQIINNAYGGGVYAFDAIDIDATGTLKPYRTFAVLAPTNLTANAGDSQVTLSWTATSGAASYNVKRSTTASGPYTTIVTKVTDTKYVDATVTNGTTYYYVVTAVNADGASGNSNEASAMPNKSTPMPTPTGNALLRVTMNDSSEREYQLSDDEINKFIEWCDRTVDTGKALYVFDKLYNVGEFKSRKEYLLFEKIISFEVMELTK